MSTLTGPKRTVLDILKIAWLLSLIPWTIEIVKSSPGFPDVAPTFTLQYWVAFGLFGILQVAVTWLSLYWQKRMLLFVIAVGISALLLVPEWFIGFLLLGLLNELVIPLALTAAIVLVIRLAKRRRVHQS